MFFYDANVYLAVYWSTNIIDFAFIHLRDEQSRIGDIARIADKANFLAIFIEVLKILSFQLDSSDQKAVSFF